MSPLLIIIISNNRASYKSAMELLTRHSWWYMFHTTALHKRSTLLANDPDSYNIKIAKKENT